jgi:hypothetical protein
LNRRALVAVALAVVLALGFAPAFAQAPSSSSGVSVSLDHYYSINTYGFGVLNDSFTFTNNGTSTAQIPTLQVGLPSKTSARTVEAVLSPSNQFSLSQSQGSNGSTVFTITPDQPTLGGGATSTVALEGILDNVMNFTGGEFTGTAQTLMMLSPSLNVNVTTLVSTISVPAGATLLTYPPGFGISSSISVITREQKALLPVASETYLGFNDTTQAGFTPISVNNVVRTIVPSANGSPTVEDEFSIHNIATYNITQIPVKLLAPGLETVTVLPNTQPPLQNPTVITLSSGILSFKSANIASPLLANSNITITLSYPLPSSLMTVTGGTVKITVPYTPIVGTYVRNYSIILAAGKGISTSGPTEVLDKPVTPLTTGSVQFTYSLSVGWAANQAVPAGIFVFAVAFAMFAIQKPAAEEEEEEKAVRKTSDVLRAFDEKTGLETQYMNEFASAPKGSISRADFDRMRNEINELRTRALQRLNQMKQVLGSGRQYDVLTRVAEAEKEEDRSFRDLLNLYLQYHGNRMNEETFRRLQPGYRRRVDSAINRLSDLLHETQTEDK